MELHTVIYFPLFPPVFFFLLCGDSTGMCRVAFLTDSSLEIPDWFICICSVLLVDEKGIYYGKCMLILCPLGNSDMTVLNRHGFKWKTLPAFFSALFSRGCVVLGTRPHCTHRVSRFGGYLQGIVLISHLSSSKIHWSIGVTEAFAIFFFFFLSS